MMKLISQGKYRRYNPEDIELIWHLADTGIRTCDFLLETAETEEQFTKTNELKDLYSQVQNKIKVNSIRKLIEMKGNVNVRR